jgi:hypothetical protein
VLFCGGDGTARDIAGVVGSRMPMLGIPAGVKMYSGVFGVSPLRSAEILLRFLKGELRPVEAEVLDLDEERYRSGEWIVRLHQTVLTPFEPTFTQLAKQLFGPSKTLRGLVVSVVATTLSAPALGLAWTTGLLAGAAAMAGDLGSSFIKRRMGLPSSSRALGLDQVPEALLPELV